MHYKKVVESEGEPCAAENWSSYTSFPTLAPMRGDQGWLALPYPVQGGLIRPNALPARGRSAGLATGN